MPEAAGPRTADELIVERAERDFEEGLAHARQRLRETHGRFVGAALDAVVMTAVNALGVRAQIRDDTRFLLSLAHRVAKGEDPARLAEENLARVMRLKSKMHFLAREDDPAFQEVLDISRALFARRLPDLARMATVADPASYDDVVRKAFPDRAHVDALVDDNAQAVDRIVDVLERHPHVLRMPQNLAPKIAVTAREMIAWKLADVRRGVDEIYASGP